MIRAAITAVAHYVPEKRLTNADLEKMVDTNDEWIRSRTGISERRILENGATTDLAAPAVRQLLKNRGIGPEEIECIVFGTVTPDMMFPSSACILQEKIGAKNAWGFDLSGACSGFLFSLITGVRMIESGAHKKVLVVGADKMSSIVDYTDRTTCILFGDAGGAVLLEPSPNPEMGILDNILRCDGSGGNYLYQSGGGSLNPASRETVEKKMHFIYQDGANVFKFAVKGMADVSEEILIRNGMSGKDVDLFVAHQANLRIIDGSARRMKLRDEQVMVNIDKYGNTTAATIPLCLSEAVDQKRLKKGDLVVLASFGAGFTWGSVLLRWAF